MVNQFRGTPAWIRPHLAALRALGIMTGVCGFIYPMAVTGIGQLPGLHNKAEGSLVASDGRIVGSALIGQSFADSAGNAIPWYFQSRPSAAGSGNGYDPTASGGSNLGPESDVDTLPDPTAKAGTPAATGTQSLLTQVCSRSAAVATLEGLPASAGARPYCTPGGTGAVLAVFGPRDTAGRVVTITRVVSVNEACPAHPFVADWQGHPVECGKPGEDYTAGLVVPVRGDAPAVPVVPADAVTASASGLDPDISPAYAALQVPRVARERGISAVQVLQLVAEHTTGRTFGFMGDPAVNVVELNRDLDRSYPHAAAPVPATANPADTPTGPVPNAPAPVSTPANPADTAGSPVATAPPSSPAP
ncbi:MAG TPA: potassium-transporting ATPase subunit C [Sporichthyaceae bacterium]|nr:potassium-transporting ATPase subunit C [Sporichthyaceae bacterium]